MRKLLLAVAVLSISLFACKKDTAPTNPNPPATSGEKFPVNFSTTGFLQKLEQLPTPNGRKTGATNTLRDSALAAKVSYLYFLLYSENGELIKRIDQNVDSTADFGNLTDTLPVGRYTMLAVASTGPVQLLETGYFSTLKVRLPDATIPFLNVLAPDVFIGTQYFTVTGYNATQPVALWPQRIMGRLEVNINDAPDASGPLDTSVLVYTTPGFRTFNYSMAFYEEQIPDPGIVLQRNSRSNFSTQLLTGYSDVTVTIVYPDQTTGERKTRELRFVPFARGYRTMMSGNLYTTNPGGNSGIGFSISLDTAWSNYAEVPF